MQKNQPIAFTTPTNWLSIHLGLVTVLWLWHLSMQIATIMPEKSSKFINKANGTYKRNYSFRMNNMQEMFEIKSCIEILVNDIKIYTTDQYTFYS